MALILPEAYANNPTTTLGAAITSTGASSITTTSSTGFPPTASGQCRIKIDDEIMIVISGIPGTTWGVQRGAEGTTAATHSNGAAIILPLTAASVKRVTELRSPEGTRTFGKSKLATFSQESLAASGTLTLLDYSDGPGAIRHMAIFITGSGDFHNKEWSRVKVYIDGEGTPSIDADMVSLHCADYGPDAFMTRMFGFKKEVTGDANLGYHNWFTIPWKTSIRVDLVNGSSSNSLTTWVNILYSTLDQDWDRWSKLWVFNERTTVTAYTEHTIIDVAGRGVFYGLYMRYDGGDGNYNYLEGDIKVYVDGEDPAAIDFTGTEDYFLNSNYFARGVGFSDFVGTVLRDNTDKVAAYRFHVLDPIEFDTNLKVTWTNGDAAVATVTNPTDINSCLWYYTDGQ